MQCVRWAALSYPTNWLIAGGSGAERLVVAPDTGVLSVAPGAHFDAASEPQLTLDVFARDECTPARITVSVSPEETAPPVVAPEPERTFSVDVRVGARVSGWLAQWIEKLLGG